jgi:hypothetical protein
MPLGIQQLLIAHPADKMETFKVIFLVVIRAVAEWWWYRIDKDWNNRNLSGLCLDVCQRLWTIAQLMMHTSGLWWHTQFCFTGCGSFQKSSCQPIDVLSIWLQVQ